MAICRLLCVLALVPIGSRLLANDGVRGPNGSAPDTHRLQAMSEEAKSAFRPVVDDDLQRARDQLLEAVNRLKGRLAMDGSNGQAWAAYLRLDDLEAEASRAEVDLDALEAITRRFSAGHYGMNRVWFAETREALVRYVQVARATQMPDLEEAYSRYIESLSRYLHSYAEKPNAEQAVQIGEAIGWLESIGQAPTLVAAVREELARPNLFAAVSKRLIVAGIEEPVEETEPVREVILGTSLYGKGRSVGDVSVDLVPNERHAVFDITYLGVTRTRNTGYNGPVVVYSQGTTGIGARKRVWINEKGIHSHPARANATTRSQIIDIQPQRGSKLVERIAWRRAMEQKHLSEAIASQRAAARAGRKMDLQAATMLEEANHGFEHEFRRPMKERNLFPKRLQFRTSDDALRLVSLQASAAQLAAPDSPPAIGEPVDLSVHIHESMVNNAAQTLLTGLTLNDTEFRMAVEDLLGHLPERLEPVPGDEPWGISFDRARPVEVRFADGGFHVTIRGRRYMKGDQPHPGMNVSASYRIVGDESGFRAVRQGEVEVIPPGLTDDQRVGTRYQIIRTLLIRRFDSIFEKEIRLDDLVLPGKWEELGAMHVVRFEANDGWLTVAWKLPD